MIHYTLGCVAPSAATRPSFQRTRRDITMGQKAIAYAILFPEAYSGERNGTASGTIPGKSRIYEARTILEFAKADIDKIIDGDENGTAGGTVPGKSRIYEASPIVPPEPVKLSSSAFWKPAWSSSIRRPKKSRR